MSSLPVKPELGPTLPDLAAPYWRRVPRAGRIALVAPAVLVVVLLALRVLGGAAGETAVVVKEPTAFNLRYGGTLQRVDPTGDEVLALRSRRDDGTLDQQFTVTPLRLPPYEGLTAGELPLYAETVIAGLERRFDDLTLVQEGRARINEVPGYELVFAARDEDGHRIYGRWVLMIPLSDPPEPLRDGVTLQLLSRWSARVPNAKALGNQGQLKLPLRSFRFGADAP